MSGWETVMKDKEKKKECGVVKERKKERDVNADDIKKRKK